MFNQSLYLIQKLKRTFFPFYKNKDLKFIFKKLQDGIPEDKVAARFVGGCVRNYLLNENIDVVLIKTNSEGNVKSTNIIETPTISKNLITTIDILGRETANNKGFQLHIYDDGSVEKKYLIK